MPLSYVPVQMNPSSRGAERGPGARSAERGAPNKGGGVPMRVMRASARRPTS